MICVNCEHNFEGAFFCPACGALQPFGAMKIDYFKLFNLPRSFDLDEAALTKAYFEAQKKFHPDRFVHKPEERAYALDYSSLVNGAYDVLKKPLLRAKYLVKIETQQDETEVSLQETELLEPLFVLQEELSDIEDLEALDVFEKKVLTQLEDAYGVLSEVLNLKQFNEARGTIAKIGYLEKMQREGKMMRKHLKGE